ncbi:UDP-glucose 4-epimerase family protein [Pseudomonas sp. LF245]
MEHIFITGAGGFLGKDLIRRLQSEGRYRLSASVRNAETNVAAGVVTHFTGAMDTRTSWTAAMTGVDVVVHCAARVHIMADKSADPLQAFRDVNVDATLHLARQAAAAGVRRFVFISSIKVNGEESQVGRPYTPDDEPKPIDAYGLSKWEAEKGLLQLAEEVEMDIVIIRPVLIYGPGVKANVQNMMRFLRRGIPLPLGAIHNKRSFVALENVTDLIVTCLDHPAASNQVFLVSDDEDLSTTDLLRRMARALHTPARLVPVPSWLLKGTAKLLGMSGFSQRLCGTLQVDISKTRSLLGWAPRIGVDQALDGTARHFLDQNKR